MAKKKKVLVLVPVAMDEKGLAKRRSQQDSVELGPDIEFDYRAVKAGPALYDSYHDFALADVAMFEAGISAEKDGYDAVCIDTMSDSGVNALRSVLDIPVIAPAKASYLMCLLLASRFGVLTQWPRWDIIYRKTLQEYGLADKCVGIRSPGLAPDPINLLGGKEEVVFPQFLKCGQELVEMGAEAICLGSTTMHEAHEFLSRELPVPIINPGPLTYKLAETVLGMGLSHSRLAYPPPSYLKLNMTRAMMDGAAEYDGED
jgi:allantoin racemase